MIANLHIFSGRDSKWSVEAHHIPAKHEVGNINRLLIHHIVTHHNDGCGIVNIGR